MIRPSYYKFGVNSFIVSGLRYELHAQDRQSTPRSGLGLNVDRSHRSEGRCSAAIYIQGTLSPRSAARGHLRAGTFCRTSRCVTSGSVNRTLVAEKASTRLHRTCRGSQPLHFQPLAAAFARTFSAHCISAASRSARPRMTEVSGQKSEVGGQLSGTNEHSG